MKRRHFIQCGAAGIAGLVGCGKSVPKSDPPVKAGPFSVAVPAAWRKDIVVEKLPIFPLYTKEEWKAYQADNRYSKKLGYICRPQHWAIRIPSALPEGVAFDLKNAGDDPTAPQILIHKADEWRVTPTDGEYLEPRAEGLLRTMRESMDAAMTQDDPQLSPGYMDGSLEFMCLKRRIDFIGGHGVRLVGQFNIEASLMELGQLHYLFLGMSDDNTCQIIATFPLGLPGLPKSGDKTHVGYNTENYEEFPKKYSAYAEDAKKWLTQHVDEITPSIRSLDEMMQSLVAAHWE